MTMELCNCDVKHKLSSLRNLWFVYVSFALISLLMKQFHGSSRALSQLMTTQTNGNNATLPVVGVYDEYPSAESNEVVDPSVSVVSAPCQIHTDHQSNLVTCCAKWEVNIDSWWSKEYEWQLGQENKTHHCVERIADQKQLKFLKNLHNIQWGDGANCSNVWAAAMINAGYAAGIGSVLKSFLSAYAEKRPFQVNLRSERSAWIFAPNSSNVPADSDCSSRDMFCYFLPISKCSAKVGRGNGYTLGIKQQFPVHNQRRIWLSAYLTRPRTWIRRYLYNYMVSPAVPEVSGPCTVVHVRRTDVLLEKKWYNRRHYFLIADYVRHVQNHSTILLLTDDQSAVDEALEHHKEFNWKFVDRKRHYGTEGGFGQHLPSKDPIHEVLVILSELRLASQCQSLVHTQSGFIELVVSAMAYKRNNLVSQIAFDGGRQPTRDNTQSAEEFFRLMKNGTGGVEVSGSRSSNTR